MKYDQYRVEHPNGERETVRVPEFFGPAEVLKALPHCEVAMRVPPNHFCFARLGTMVESVYGPCWVGGWDGHDWTKTYMGMPMADFGSARAAVLAEVSVGR